MGGIIFLFLVAFGMLVIWVVAMIKSDEENQKRKKYLVGALNKIDTFKVAKIKYCVNFCSLIAIDTENKKICLIKLDKKSVLFGVDIVDYNTNPFVFLGVYSDIVSVVIHEDENIIQNTTTSRTSQITGAAVGGLLFGAAGAVVGGLSGNNTTTSKKEVKKISIKIIVNNTENPVFEINIANNDTPMNTTGYLYKQYSQEAYEWFGLIKALIHKSDIEANNKANNNNVSEKKHISIADELLKLSELKDKGILTNEEFEKQKQKILSDLSAK
jgi:hypothetical protein